MNGDERAVLAVALVVAALFLASCRPAGAQPVGPPLAPGLAIGAPDNCQGSVAGGVATGVFGLSFGATREGEDCNRRAYAKAAAAMGDRETAEEILCEADAVRRARIRSGRPCRADGGSAQAQARQEAQSVPPRAGALEVKPLDVCPTLSSPAERRAYASVCGGGRAAR